MEEEGEDCVKIQQFPDNILLSIFCNLTIQDVINVALTCKEWWRVCQDDFLWRDFFSRDWKVKKAIAAGKTSWRYEYKRLKYHTPVLVCEELKSHRDQVLHVSFSHNGQLFATCSKDGTCKVWTSEHPCRLLFKYDMKQFHWKYTQYSQFNMSDSLLLVSGVHFGETSTSGEIAVFSIQDNFELQCRMINKPYDIFGTWYNDTHLLSGSLYWTGHLNSCSALWLNMATQAIETENESVVMRLFKFHNQNASSIRTLIIANCYSEQQRFLLKRRKLTLHHINSCESCSTKYLDSLPSFDDCDLNESVEIDKFAFVNPNNVSHSQFDVEEVRQLPRYNKKVTERNRSRLNGSIENEDDGGSHSEGSASEKESSPETVQNYNSAQCSSFEGTESTPHDVEVTLCDNFKLSDTTLSTSDAYTCDKLLIFTLGSKTFSPHQIGIKRVESLEPANKSGLQESNRNRLLPDVADNMQGLDRTYDKVDHLIEMDGHVIGMCLSPDHRYLYVNCRHWPENYKIEDSLEPPPLAQEIEIHVIDLHTIKEVGPIFKSHKAYTANDECFFIFLDVSDEYVASGAEDKHGYIWDRHYGVCLHTFQHNDVVNSVAFNPANPEMLVTVSDDLLIKVWRSRNWFKRNNKLMESKS